MCHYALVPAGVGLRGRKGVRGVLLLRAAVHRQGEALGDLVDGSCNLPPIIIFIIMFSSTCSTRRMRVSYSETEWKLNPEREIHRNAVALDLHVFRRRLLGHAQLHRESLGLERAGVLGGLPLLHAVGDGGREVVEAADERVDLFRGAQNAVLFGCVFFHVR